MIRALALAVLTSACGRLDFDPIGGSSSDGAVDGAVNFKDAPIPCTEDTSIGLDGTSSVGQGTRVMTDRGLVGSCGGATSAEGIFKVNLSSSGTYQFEVQTAGPFVAYVRDNACAGPELACTTTPMTTPIVLPFPGPHVVYVIIDDVPIGTSVTLQVSGI